MGSIPGPGKIPHVCACVYTQSLSHVQFFVAQWTAACQAPLSMRFPRQEYWNGLPFPSPGNLPHPGTEPESLMSPAVAGGFFTTSATRGDLTCHGATKAMCYNYWAWVLGPGKCNWWAHVQQPWGLHTLEPMSCNKRNHCRKKPAHCKYRVAPTRR